MTVLDVVTQFRAKSLLVEEYIQNAFHQGQNGNYIFDENFRSFIIESCVIKLYIAWEEFLEECFTCYSMAEPSISGLQYVRYSTPPNREHAKRMPIGNQSYIEWGNPNAVLTLCKLYLQNGEPLRSAIASVNQDLLDLRTIRNAAAHLSTTTKAAFESAASRILGRSSNGITVSDFLLLQHPASAVNDTVFMHYNKTLNAVTSLIAR